MRQIRRQMIKASIATPVTVISFKLKHFRADLAMTCYPWRVANTALLA